MLRSLATKPKSRHPIFTTTRPQITPSGLVLWRDRVKVRSGLTLPNAHKHWQPLRVGLSKQPLTEL